jgi:uncharacterized protein DUF6256
MLAASVIRQAVVPMAAFYLILMTALGLGLLGVLRSGTRPAHPGDAGPAHPGDAAAGTPGPAATLPRAARGRAALIRRVLTTAAGGYLLLMAVVVAYYYAIARVGGEFLQSAVTGTALLIGLALPVFAAASWVYGRVHSRGGAAPGGPRRLPRA